MSNLKEIKNKIVSVKNTEKTTKAMKLVSNVKLKKAKEAARKSSAYAIKINEILSEISYELKQNAISLNESNFFNASKEVTKVDIIFVTSDKGLCGGFNMNTIKTVKELINEYKTKQVKIRLRAVGKKGIEYFKFQGVDLLKTYVGVSSSPNYEKAIEIINDAINDFEKGLTDKVILVHNGYKSMIAQQIRINDIVPIEPISASDIVNKSTSLLEIEAEDKNALMTELIKKYFEYSMYFSLIDSLAAEHSARMQAMDSATSNAKQRVFELNLEYNKARQSSITTELTEIISGVESMK
ncbi:F0F1 ATP synthase subunit gamma [Campylobacter sputorum subsp. bubulus]|uniref:ATP synthase gamma chain n=1 Tax=Campylobacter sputorum subsp. sputorum TaxID=32024 RepID=A0A381DJE8_9BACT|nr:ATP synthase F1 subunit gamma [Campylobacter sputorum]ASM35822.1 ATP synthase, F1 complex, gamma subunit [Campylobacter sputorum aubsp. sputorum RM3237]ASM39180.1 ATP synthase, F1 complex, gamma subunit [Campylobacter sputorum bv. paraureolyticus LMG 11764]KAB0581535.1 F0F1 ATP synthase subunit gamma [Campylobacter sputorum subsp. sputorum]MDY6120890.1 ATP synthase F1 subunit gamma [Campylobacter sputorum]QEL06012.1 ATP synthase, F1 complex, gamma subunit [Campylobacter sputorum subsp. sput